MNIARDLSNAYKDDNIITSNIEKFKNIMKELIGSYKNKKLERDLINKSIEELKEQIKSANNNKKYWSDIKRNVELIDCIVNRVPLRVIPNYAEGVTLITRFDNTKFAARIYTNGWNKKYYGLDISGCKDKEDSFRGKYWENKADCIESGKLWVASNKLPPINGKGRKVKKKIKKRN
jgi:hypothetical protein